MSPSWRESLQVEVGAQEVRVRRCSRGWRPRVLREGRAAMAALTPQAVSQALTAALAQVPGRAAPAQVQLSGDWVRFALLEGAAALRGAAERSAAAAHALRRVYGDSAQGWRVCQGSAGRDTLLAAGIDPLLHDELQAALTATGAAMTALRPSFTQAVNQCRRWLAAPAWFVAVEPGRAVVCYTDGAQLRSLRSHRVRRELAAELPAWLEQGRLVDGHAERDAALVLAYRGTAPVYTAPAGLNLRLVDLDGGA